MTDMATSEQIERGEGWAIAPSIDSLGDGMFRPVRPALGITAFGMNVKVMEPESSSKNHLHTEQQEVIFVHAGEIHVSFGDGTTHEVGVGGIVVIDANQPHVVRVTSDVPAVLVMMGGKGGVVEGDAQMLSER
ncbi:MAG: Cupin 2 conserved barrel domain protein [Thermoleophilia bacterium]|nr:Cupin 2 conserved barrel domain protein [Thermoleophilia bacterium]